jgi:hypothetical protein
VVDLARRRQTSREVIWEYVSERGQRSTSSRDQTIILSPDGLGELDSTHAMTARECRVNGVQLVVLAAQLVCSLTTGRATAGAHPAVRLGYGYFLQSSTLTHRCDPPSVAAVTPGTRAVFIAKLYLAIQSSYGRSDTGFGASW